MPGMDGYEVAALAADAGRQTPASARRADRLGQGEDRRRALEAGFDHHLVKPVDPSLLQEVLYARMAQAATRKSEDSRG